MNGQLDEMRIASRQTEELVTATKRYADATVAIAQIGKAGQKPGINVDAEIIGPLTFNNGVRIELRFIFRNDGTAIANSISAWATMFLQGENRSRRDPGIELKQMCGHGQPDAVIETFLLLASGR